MSEGIADLSKGPRGGQPLAQGYRARQCRAGPRTPGLLRPARAHPLYSRLFTKYLVKALRCLPPAPCPLAPLGLPLAVGLPAIPATFGSQGTSRHKAPAGALVTALLCSFWLAHPWLGPATW